MEVTVIDKDGSRVTIFGATDIQQNGQCIVSVKRGREYEELEYEEVVSAVDVPDEDWQIFLEESIKSAVNNSDRVIINMPANSEGNRIRQVLNNFSPEFTRKIKGNPKVIHYR